MIEGQSDERQGQPPSREFVPVWSIDHHVTPHSPLAFNHRLIED